MITELIRINQTFINYYVINNFLIKINLINFNKFFINKLNNFYILSNFYKTKYSWLEIYEDKDNETNLNYINPNHSSIIYINNNLYYNKLENIISLKKNSSIFKKNSDINYSILNYINILKNKYENSNLNNFLNYDTNNIEIKNFDFSRKIKPLIKTNRIILKKFNNIKYYRKFSFSKNIKQLVNYNKYNTIFKLENSILNIVMKCDFFFSINDCIWFFKNSLISLNSVIIKNYNKLVFPNNIINISFNNIYFDYYKEFLDKIINNIYKINSKIWFFSKNRTYNLNNKENYPKWINNYKFFKKDIPLNLEVDYTTMTIIFLNYNFNYKNFTYYNFKFINIYLNRLYNWKYIS